jgi:hypothetical protein
MRGDAAPLHDPSGWRSASEEEDVGAEDDQALRRDGKAWMM